MTDRKRTLLVLAPRLQVPRGLKNVRDLKTLSIGNLNVMDLVESKRILFERSVLSSLHDFLGLPHSEGTPSGVKATGAGATERVLTASKADGTTKAVGKATVAPKVTVAKTKTSATKTTGAKTKAGAAKTIGPKSESR